MMIPLSRVLLTLPTLTFPDLGLAGEAPPSSPPDKTTILGSHPSANGTLASINRGIEEKSGWNPPVLELEDPKTISLEDFCLKFKEAAKYKAFFEAAGKNTT